MPNVSAVVQVDGLNQARAQMEGLGRNAPNIMAAALNAAGELIRQQTVKAEAKQTGLKVDVLERAQHKTNATPGRLTFSIVARGGNIRIKHFGAVEGRGGVTARPWGRSQFFQGAFIMSGRPGSRYAVPRLNGQVYERVDQSDLAWNRKGGANAHKSKIRQVRSDVFIPKEMLRGQTRAAFERGVEPIGARILARIANI